MMTKGRNNRADYHTRRVIEDELREHLSTTVENEDRDQQLVAYKDGSSDAMVAKIVAEVVKKRVTPTNVLSVRRLCFGRLRLDAPEPLALPPPSPPATLDVLQQQLEAFEARLEEVEKRRVGLDDHRVIKELRQQIADQDKTIGQQNTKIAQQTKFIADFITDMEKRWRQLQPGMLASPLNSPELPL
jgi:uncharacterized coiled-coil protein SlyX